MSRHATLFVCAAAAAALTLSACSPHETGLDEHLDTATAAVASKAPLSPQQMEAKAAEAAQDASITARIKAQFANDPPLDALHIQVFTREGEVTLSGKAPDASLRERATRLAATVKDVLSVDNKMILPI